MQSTKIAICRLSAAALLCAGISLATLPQQALAQEIASASGAATAIAEQAPSAVSNFEKVSPSIWRGALPSERGLRALKHDGIKTVIDLRLEGSGTDKEATLSKELGMQYIHVPLGFGKPDQEKLHSVLTIMSDAAKQPVFIHCRQGADRTGMLVGMYRRIFEGWSFEKTYKEMRRHGFKPFLASMRKEVEVAPEQHQALTASAHKPESESSVALRYVDEPSDNSTEKHLLSTKPIAPSKILY